MTTIRIKMVDCDRCIICGNYIGKGHDPAVCSDNCLYWYHIECDFNKWAKQQATDRAINSG